MKTNGSLTIFALLVLFDAAYAGRQYNTDICVYGGTASGMMSAMAAAERGHSVIVVEPSRWLGGIVGGGIQILQDCAYPNDIGVLTKMMMQKDQEIGGGRHENQSSFRELFVQMANKYHIRVIYEHRLGNVQKNGKQITRIDLDFAPLTMTALPLRQKRRRMSCGFRQRSLWMPVMKVT